MGSLSALNSSANFGTLLKSWRTTRKLSQLDLALNSAVSQRHVSFLESGRARPSQKMVMQLSEALDVPLRERNSLLQAAGFAVYYHHRDLEHETMAPIKDALVRMLDHHAPYPALVIDRDYNILMENRPFSALLGLFGDPQALWDACCPDLPRNLLRLVFHRAGARPAIKNFDQVGPLLLQRAWRESLIDGSATREFIEALKDDLTLPAEWHHPDPTEVPAPVLSLELAVGELECRLFTMITTFGTPHDITTDELRVESFFPADSETEHLLRGLGNSRT